MSAQPVLVTPLRSLPGYGLFYGLVSGIVSGIVLLLLVFSQAFASDGPGKNAVLNTVHHDITINLLPGQQSLSVTDTLTIPRELIANGKLEMFLHAGLNPRVTTPNVKLQIHDYKSVETPVPLQRLVLSLPVMQNMVTLTYEGRIHHPVEELGAEYARSFSVSPGIVSKEGVFLSGSSYWYARTTRELHTFGLRVELPEGWTSVSQGQKKSGNISGKERVSWSIDKPQDEIYLIAAPFKEYKQASGAVEAMVFLRKPDDKLAQKYLDVTAQYIEMYRQLIGTYPYKKFALVENFWETGYGMPSFTLLGPRVIRFPFILHSSYPHEILHNWWGNGVYVDYQTGNWAEGLTSYLADHLIKEQRGQATNYRRNALQKYTDFVRGNRDFPLAAFRSRHNATTEAIGYGKTLMFFHMLRQQVGDAQFVRALKHFYRLYRFKYAGFSDIKKVFENVTEHNLTKQFEQWVERTGAPGLRVYDARVEKSSTGYSLTATIEQTQTGAPYDLRVPLSVDIEGSDKTFQTTQLISSKIHKLKLETQGRPLRLDVDPEFDVFRRLHRNEIPPALTRAFGAEKVLILLPSRAQAEQYAAYEKLAQSWQRGQQAQISIKSDSEVKKLPADTTVWVFGWDNLFVDAAITSLKDYSVTKGKNGFTLDKTLLSRNRHAVVMTARHPDNADHAITLLLNDNIKAMPGLGRKLPHYGRYSYLGFEGEEPVNIAKGQWPVINSPMSVVLATSNNTDEQSRPERKKRHALAQLPAVFSEKRMLQDVAFLANENMRGRGLGTKEIDKAADFIAGEFAKAGLQPAGQIASNGKADYFQRWRENVGEPLGDITLTNVVAVLPGSKPEWNSQSLIVAAHYDHLGLGWPDVHKGDEGKIHYGADDNASGVAVMLEVARLMAKKGPFDRSIIFVALTGEETGKQLGARHFIDNAGTGQYPLSDVMAMLNLDTVGRLGNNKLTVLGTGSAREWVHVFRGVGFVTGIEIQSVADDYGSSDQKSFIEQGIPAVQFFSGAHKDFHRPSDTVDKIDSAGLVKVATVLKEAIEYLAARAEPLTVQLANNRQQKQSNTPATGRRVTLGTVPDFSYSQGGVRIAGVSEGTPAEKAGLREGDIIVKLNNRKIEGLRDFAAVLRSLKDNDSIDIVYMREGEQKKLTTHVIAR